MDLDQLQAVRDRERGSDDLQELREDFYADAAAFIADLRRERAAAAEEAAEPFDSPRVTRLTDRIRTAEQTLEAIYEKRVGKVVKSATFAAADLPAEADGMTTEEADLFETLVAEIEANRETVLGRLDDADDDLPGSDVLDTEGDDVPAANAMGGGEGTANADRSPGEPNPTSEPADVDRQASTDAPTTAADEPPAGEPSEPAAGRAEPEPPDGAGPESPDEPDQVGDGGEATAAGERAVESPATDEPEASDVERELVRITEDVGAILGVDDREYDLAEDDVVTLPAANARPLIEQGVAERLE